MSDKKYIHALLYLFVFILTLLLLAEGTVIPIHSFKPVGLAITISILLYGLFEKWVWKWRLFHPWFVSTPNISGTWKGQLISNWINPETNQLIPAIEAYLIIRQTLHSIQVKLVTSQSSSDLIGGRLKKKGDSTYQITGVYINTAKLSYREKSPIHFGGILLEVQENSILMLEGHYWTDRKTGGEMFFKEHKNIICASFEDAKNIFNKY